MITSFCTKFRQFGLLFLFTSISVVICSDDILLTNGIKVSKERFNKVYEGVQEIFGKDVQCDQKINLEFLKEVTKNDTDLSHLGWSKQHTNFVKKETIYYIAQHTGELSSEDRPFSHYLYDLLSFIDYTVINDAFAEQLYGNNADARNFVPQIYSPQQWKFYNQLLDANIVQVVELLPNHVRKMGITAETIAILKAILVKKTPNSVACLKELDF